MSTILKQDDGVGDAWADLAESRFIELDSSAVQGTTWEEIKQQVVTSSSQTASWKNKRPRRVIQGEELSSIILEDRELI